MWKGKGTREANCSVVHVSECTVKARPASTYFFFCLRLFFFVFFLLWLTALAVVRELLSETEENQKGAVENFLPTEFKLSVFYA